MLTSNQDFRLVSFGQDALSPEVYAQAERVYLDSIGSTARTNANEIAYWKDRYNREFWSRGDKLYIYGLLGHDEVIGFALVFFFKSQNLVVIDHIAIKEPARNFGSFFYFKSMIAQHLLEQGHQIDFAIAEIVTSTLGDPHPVEPQLLIQLLKQAGFKVAHLHYYTPSIREDEYSSRIDAALMIYRNERGSRIRSTKLMALLDCILNDLYLRWYKPHSLDLKAFRKQIKMLRETYMAELSVDDSVVLNGNWNEQHTQIPRKLGPGEKSKYDGVLQSSGLFFLLILASALLAWISYFFGINVLSVIFVFLTSLFGLLALLAVWRKEAATQVDKVQKVLLSFLRRDKDVG
jgi:hypothetical protein